MTEHFVRYWYLYLILFIMIVLTVFVGKKALAASSKRRKELDDMMAKAKSAKELREAYGNLTQQIIDNAPAASLFEGTALNLEYACQKTDDTNGFYEAMTDGEKKIYALFYLLTDAKDSALSTFFKSSYRLLTSDAVEAAKEILDSRACAVIEAMFNCYDENNEEASVIPQEIDRLDKEFDEIAKATDLFAASGEYIKKNAGQFLK